MIAEKTELVERMLSAAMASDRRTDRTFDTLLKFRRSHTRQAPRARGRKPQEASPGASRTAHNFKRAERALVHSRIGLFSTLPWRTPVAARKRTTGARQGALRENVLHCGYRFTREAHLFRLGEASRLGRRKLRLLSKRPVLLNREIAFAIERGTVREASCDLRRAISQIRKEHVAKILQLLALREAGRDRKLRLETAELFDHRQPLLLVHGIARNQKAPHIFHARVIGCGK